MEAIQYRVSGGGGVCGVVVGAELSGVWGHLAMNWLDPEQVRAWLDVHPEDSWPEQIATMQARRAAVEFVKALAKVSAIDPEFSWGRISVCALLIARRLEGGDEG